MPRKGDIVTLETAQRESNVSETAGWKEPPKETERLAVGEPEVPQNQGEERRMVGWGGGGRKKSLRKTFDRVVAGDRGGGSVREGSED